MDGPKEGEARTEGRIPNYIKGRQDWVHFRKTHKDQRYYTEVWELFKTWKPKREVWCYQYGPFVLGALSTAAASYINFHFRSTLYLLNYSRVTSYMAMFLAPGFTAGFFHYNSVTRRIMEEAQVCPVCYQVRGMLIQGISGLFYPLVICPIICYPLVKRFQSYSVPNVNFQNRYALFNFTKEILRPIRGRLWAMAAIQIVAGMGMASYEYSNFYNVIKPKLAEIPNFHSPMYTIPESTIKKL